MASLLITLLVFAIIAAIVVAIVRALGLPAPWLNILLAVLGLIALVWLLNFFGVLGSSWHLPRNG